MNIFVPVERLLVDHYNQLGLFLLIIAFHGLVPDTFYLCSIKLKLKPFQKKIYFEMKVIFGY